MSVQFFLDDALDSEAFQRFDEALQLLRGVHIGVFAAAVDVLAALGTGHAKRSAERQLFARAINAKGYVVDAFAVLIKEILPTAADAVAQSARAECFPARRRPFCRLHRAMVRP